VQLLLRVKVRPRRTDIDAIRASVKQALDAISEKWGTL